MGLIKQHMIDMEEAHKTLDESYDEVEPDTKNFIPGTSVWHPNYEERIDIIGQNGNDGLHYDDINHPNHYTEHPSGVECITITQHMNFCIGNAIKYLWRNGLKEGNPAVKDLKKAVWYINKEIERLEDEHNSVS